MPDKPETKMPSDSLEDDELLELTLAVVSATTIEVRGLATADRHRLDLDEAMSDYAIDEDAATRLVRRQTEVAGATRAHTVTDIVPPAGKVRRREVLRTDSRVNLRIHVRRARDDGIGLAEVVLRRVTM